MAGPVITRPTAEQYQQALDYYRTGTSIETIGERLDLSDDQLDQLEHEGWPLDEHGPALAALRAEVLVRLTRIRAGELDVLAAIADSAAKTAPKRARAATIAATIEDAILSQWGRTVQDKMTKGARVTPADLCMPKAVLDNLKALRALQDPDVDRGFVDIFLKMRGEKNDGSGGDSLEDAIIRDLVGLTPEEQAEYAMTGNLPKRQQELPFEESAA